ncbi:MAG: RloB domain-containing protein [Lachnospiraceae bacterium]|nr:RloB domain-containing protein [Lachnospiraceae bacterium]
MKIVMSNPNFELWLLMHFPNINQYNPQMLLENKKNLRHQLFKNASTGRRYLEILVSQNAEGYSKGKKLRFERFLPFVEGAVEQAKLFCESSRGLIDELGTSVGRLIEEMMQQ